jgi:hypothetical protein
MCKIKVLIIMEKKDSNQVAFGQFGIDQFKPYKDWDISQVA